MSASELASYIGCSATIITAMANRGQLPCNKVGSLRSPHGFTYELTGNADDLKRLVLAKHPNAGKRMGAVLGKKTVTGLARDKDLYTVKDLSIACGKTPSMVRRKAKEMGLRQLDMGGQICLLKDDAKKLVDHYASARVEAPQATTSSLDARLTRIEALLAKLVSELS